MIFGGDTKKPTISDWISNMTTVTSFTRFVILLSTIEGAKTSEATIRAHVAFLRKLDQEGKLVHADHLPITMVV